LCSIVFFSLAGLAGCTSQPSTINQSVVSATKIATTVDRPVLTSGLLAVLPAPQAPVFRGELTVDQDSGGTYSPLYYGPDLVTLATSVAVHAAFESGRQSGVTNTRQIAADEILEPYLDSIGEMNIADIIASSVQKLDVADRPVIVANEVATGSKPRVNLYAHYQMARDQKAIALYLTGLITIDSSESFTHLVNVVSPAVTGSPVEHWLGNDAQALKIETAALMAEGVRLLLADIRGGLDAVAPRRTVRYRYGGSQVSERASVIETGCDRLAMRNLRNWVLSVPVTGGHCGSVRPAQ